MLRTIHKIFAVKGGKAKNKDSLQIGRSIIEMLGVLSIVGVLTIAGIAGYDKAIHKHRLNQSLYQIASIVAAMQTEFTGHNYKLFGYEWMGSTYNNGETLEDFDIIPDNMRYFSGVHHNLWGGTVKVAADGKYEADDKKAFLLIYEGLPYRACVDLATSYFDSAANGFMLLAINNDPNSIFFNNCVSSDDIVCAGDQGGITRVINTCLQTGDNYIVWKYF